MWGRRRVTLRSINDAGGLQHLDALMDGDAVALVGHDLGPGVHEATDGAGTEYEWVTRVAAEDVPALVQALGGRPGEHVISVMRRYRGARSHQVEELMRAHQVPFEFWNRIGD